MCRRGLGGEKHLLPGQKMLLNRIQQGGENGYINPRWLEKRMNPRMSCGELRSSIFPKERAS